MTTTELDLPEDLDPRQRKLVACSLRSDELEEAMSLRKVILALRSQYVPLLSLYGTE